MILYDIMIYNYKMIDVHQNIEVINNIIQSDKDVIYINLNDKKNNLYNAFMNDRIDIVKLLIDCDEQVLYGISKENRDYMLVHLIIYNKIIALEYLYTYHTVFLQNAIINNRHKFINGAFTKTNGYNYLKKLFPSLII